MRMSQCCTCGKEWPTGTNGSHDCSRELLRVLTIRNARITELELQLKRSATTTQPSPSQGSTQMDRPTVDLVKGYVDNLRMSPRNTVIIVDHRAYRGLGFLSVSGMLKRFRQMLQRKTKTQPRQAEVLVPELMEYGTLGGTAGATMQVFALLSTKASLSDVKTLLANLDREYRWDLVLVGFRGVNQDSQVRMRNLEQWLEEGNLDVRVLDVDGVELNGNDDWLSADIFLLGADPGTPGPIRCKQWQPTDADGNSYAAAPTEPTLPSLSVEQMIPLLLALGPFHLTPTATTEGVVWRVHHSSLNVSLCHNSVGVTPSLAIQEHFRQLIKAEHIESLFVRRNVFRWNGGAFAVVNDLQTATDDKAATEAATKAHKEAHSRAAAAGLVG